MAGGVRAARQSNAARNQAVAPSNVAGTPSNAAGSQAAGPSNPAGAVGNMPTAISLSTLKKATNNFRKQIGEGGAAHVYKGKLDDGQLIAVKRMKTRDSRDESYDNEIGVLSHLNHPNIINLIGCCFHNDTERIIVYEFMPNGNLKDHLHVREKEDPREKDDPVLDWKTRMNIGVGIAEGLRYLHNNANRRVIYRDLKPRNVLLDADYNPKISDFGISILLPDDGHTTSVTTPMPMGTPPYWAPEDAVVHTLSLKSDVFSFGVVLLEIITGTANMNEKNKRYVDDSVLVPENFVHQADPKMKVDFPRGELVKAMTVATKCMNLCPESRPDIGVVVNAMRNLAGEQDAHWPEIFSTDRIESNPSPRRLKSI
ncbi:hypothetical protein CASFOL_012872 [Castilleja foliolosa]|uniref:non-specific serine/threonine protein kinase n=1 Tax=Castilleja foliolosa TaxID=1961234 RepID=A0ABD3DJ33_9LAMI